MAELEHWIAASLGRDRAKEAGFLWLNPRHTGGQGHLWMVVEGVGGEGVGDVVAALATITMTELYPEALDMFRDPLKAMEVALQDADRRLTAFRAVYPDLKNGRASFAAVALFDGAYHVAWGGAARATLVKAGETERLTEDRVEAIRDGVAIPSTGLGAGGSLIHFAGSYELGINAIALTTHSITKSVREPALGQGVERLAAWDVVPAVLSLTSRADERASGAIAVVRAEPLLVKPSTTVDAFLQWAEGEASTWESKTLMLQTKVSQAPGTPQVTNYAGLPHISGAGTAAEEEDLKESTMSFSPEDIRRIVQDSRQQRAGHSSRSDSGSLPFARTNAMNNGDVAAAHADAVRETTERFGTGQETTERAGTGANDDPAPTPPRPASAPAGTMMFSPQELAELRTDAEQRLAATSASSDDELAQTGDPLPVFRPHPEEGVEETKLFSPGDRPPPPQKLVSPEADDTETWQGESLSVTSVGVGGRRRGATALVLIALLIGVVATYFGFIAN